MVANNKRSATGFSLELLYAISKAGGADTVTANFNGSLAGGALLLHEYSGVDTSTPLDVTSSQATSGATIDSGSQMTRFANDLIFGTAGRDSTSTLTPGSSFTMRENNQGRDSEDRIAVPVGTYNATFTGGTSSNFYVAEMAAFKAAGSALPVMLNTGPVSSSTGRVKYRLSVPLSQAAGTYSNIVTYILTPTY